MRGPGTMPPGMIPPARVRLQPSGWHAEQEALREEAEREAYEQKVAGAGIAVRVVR